MPQRGALAKELSHAQLGAAGKVGLVVAGLCPYLLATAIQFFLLYYVF